MTRIRWVLGWVAIGSSAACSHPPRSATEEIDLGKVNALFGCANAPAGDAKEACRVAREFDAASTFAAPTTPGVATWVGPAYCSDPKMAALPGSLNWRVLHVQPGKGEPFVYGGGMKPPDGSRVLPFKADFPSFGPSNGPGGHIVEQWQGWLAELQADRTPTLSPAQKVDYDFAKTVSIPLPLLVVKSDGKSLRVEEGTFVRQIDRRVLAITPVMDETGTMKSACVVELWRLP